jgi:Leucine-rich repeat (LRR) protein
MNDKESKKHDKEKGCKEKPLIYKNDLKFNEKIDIESSDWDTDDVKDMYNTYKKKSKIELRIKDSELEAYEYLDLSNLCLNDKVLCELIELPIIINILQKIKFLDISSNKLTVVPNTIYNYKNIIYMNFSNNKITGFINNNNIIELSCENNKIEGVNSTSITKLSASNNTITSIHVPNIEILIINSNAINKIDSYNNLTYLECIDNNITQIANMPLLTEIFISNNQLIDIENMNKLKVLNCINNPIKKIKYLKSIDTILCSTPYVSSRYKIKSINKVNTTNYLINMA